MPPPSLVEKPLAVSYREAQRVIQTGRESWFIDFGKAVFGSVELNLADRSGADSIALHLGEQLKEPFRIDRQPTGHIRFRSARLGPPSSDGWQRAEIPADKRNTGPRAIKMPAHIGEVLPFRYCEIEGLPAPLAPGHLRQTFVHYPFDDSASHFECSNPVLNDVWQLCKHTIKATTFCGLYVDGDRERIPYEGDAYINQLSHYCVDAEYGVARRTHEHLLRRATWPTDWLMHSVFMAWYDYLYTGDSSSLESNYELLKLKALACLAREDGLISAKTGLVTDRLMEDLGLDDFFAHENLNDVIDWPQPGFRGFDIMGETDGYEFGDYNTAINAIHYRALILMARIADVLNYPEDVSFHRSRAKQVGQSINQKLFDASTGLYRDNLGSSHSSQHANFFPLMAGCVPSDRVPQILKFIESRGMACSVYGAQHLLDALYKAGSAQLGLELMASTGKRSWANMIYSVRSTMTLEAWDPSFKPNLDFNHAWGAAPANILIRRLMGIRPASPGFESCIIDPQPGNLAWASARVPTPHGPVEVEFWNEPGKPLQLAHKLPEGVARQSYR